MGLSDMPDFAMIVGDNGEPLGVLDTAKMTADATRLMFQMAAAAGDDAELDRIGIKWTSALDPDTFGMVAAGALSLLVRCILAPTLDVIDQVMPSANFRAKLVQCRDDVSTLGGDE